MSLTPVEELQYVTVQLKISRMPGLSEDLHPSLTYHPCRSTSASIPYDPVVSSPPPALSQVLVLSFFVHALSARLSQSPGFSLGLEQAQNVINFDYSAPDVSIAPLRCASS